MSTIVAKVFYIALMSCLLGASLEAAFRDPWDDAYPFSTYPMFASKREAPTFAIAEGVDKSGNKQPIAPELVGSDEVMQAAATIRHASRNRRDAQRLCRAISKRAGKSSELRQVRILRVQYDPLAYFVSGPEPMSEKVVARCSVGKTKKRKKKSTPKKKGSSQAQQAEAVK